MTAVAAVAGVGAAMSASGAVAVGVGTAALAVVVARAFSTLSDRSRRQRPAIICIEGVVGAGKTSLLRAIQALLGPAVIVVPENVGLWRELPALPESEEPQAPMPAQTPAPTLAPTLAPMLAPTPPFNVLESFYASPAQNALPFQVLVLATRVNSLRGALAMAAESPSVKWIVVERSSGGDACFARIAAREGHIAPQALAVYEHARAEFDALVPRVDAHVHVNLSVDAAMQRVAERGRPEEQGEQGEGGEGGEGRVTAAYQRELANELAGWLTTRRACGVPVLTLGVDARTPSSVDTDTDTDDADTDDTADTDIDAANAALARRVCEWLEML